MFDQHLPSRFLIAQLKLRHDRDHGCVPGELSFVHKGGEQQRGHRFGVRRHHEKRFSIDRSGLPLLADAETAFEKDFAILVQAERYSRDAQFRPGHLDELFDLCYARAVERIGFAPGE